MTRQDMILARIHSDLENHGADPIHCPCCGAQKAKPGIIPGFCDDCGWKVYKRTNTLGDVDVAEYLTERLHTLARREKQGKRLEKCHHCTMTASGIPQQYQCSMYATTTVEGRPCCTSHARRTKGYYWAVDTTAANSPLTSVLTALAANSKSARSAILAAASIISEQNETKT